LANKVDNLTIALKTAIGNILQVWTHIPFILNEYHWQPYHTGTIRKPDKREKAVRKSEGKISNSQAIKWFLHNIIGSFSCLPDGQYACQRAPVDVQWDGCSVSTHAPCFIAWNLH